MFLKDKCFLCADDYTPVFAWGASKNIDENDVMSIVDSLLVIIVDFFNFMVLSVSHDSHCHKFSSVT